MGTRARQTVRYCKVCRKNVRVTWRVHPRSNRRDAYCHECNHTTNTEPKHKETTRDANPR